MDSIRGNQTTMCCLFPKMDSIRKKGLVVNYTQPCVTLWQIRLPCVVCFHFNIIWTFPKVTKDHSTRCQRDRTQCHAVGHCWLDWRNFLWRLESCFLWWIVLNFLCWSNNFLWWSSFLFLYNSFDNSSRSNTRRLKIRRCFNFRFFLLQRLCWRSWGV